MRKKLLSMIGILIIICTIFLIYEKLNKRKVENNNSMFAIFLEEEKDTGRYQKSNLKTWPTENEYIINMNKSYCENGSILRWNNETKKLSLKVTGTDKCYVYFDKAEIGSEKHPHLIQTIEDLVRLSNDVNGGKSYEGEYFLLTNDLDFNDASDYEDANRLDFEDINGINGDEPLITELTTGSGFEPIGTGSDFEFKTFKGKFDGSNHTIENLYINNDIDLMTLGLFGGIEDATIKNLTITGDINSTVRANIGGISGEAIGNIEISNCISKINSISQSNGYSVGGIIGAYDYRKTNMGTMKINQCINYGKISGSNNSAGIVGFNNGILTIQNSVNYGEITNNLGHYVGGLIGRSNTNTNSAIIKNSHNEGLIFSNSSEFKQIGGLAGRIEGNITIDNCYNSADVKCEGQNNGNCIGGLIGYITNSSEKEITITNSYNSGEVKSGAYTGGLIGWIYEITKPIIISNSYNTGNISSSMGYLSSLVAMVRTSPIYVLNSYNLGTLTSESDVGGLVRGSYASNIYLINCYNIGKINATDFASGLVMSAGWNGTDRNYIYLNNLYNIGEYSDASYIYGIGWLNQATGNIVNTYYPDNVTALGAEVKTGGTAMAINDMKKQEFVDTLNQNVESINLREIDESLKDYTLSKWQLSSNGYPELINE